MNGWSCHCGGLCPSLSWEPSGQQPGGRTDGLKVKMSFAGNSLYSSSPDRETCYDPGGRTDMGTRRANEHKMVSPSPEVRVSPGSQHGKIQGQGSIGPGQTPLPPPIVLRIPSRSVAAGIPRPILLSWWSQGRAVRVLISGRLAGPGLQHAAWVERRCCWLTGCTGVSHLSLSSGCQGLASVWCIPMGFRHSFYRRRAGVHLHCIQHLFCWRVGWSWLFSFGSGLSPCVKI